MQFATKCFWAILEEKRREKKCIKLVKTYLCALATIMTKCSRVVLVAGI